jgi:hypothetical protein
LGRPLLLTFYDQKRNDWRKEEMSNTNCMEGLRCPSCKQEDGLRIECIVVCKVTNDGIAPSGDLDFTDGSWCHCPACEHEGTVKDFRLYRVFNDTDGIYASEGEMHWERAGKFMEQFHERFKAQGYYRTALGQNIPLEQIRLCLEPVMTSN